MINPENITKYDRSEEELEEFLLFCILVAGKNSDIQARKLDDFLKYRPFPENVSPFKYISSLDEQGILETVIRECKLGQYNRVVPSFRDVSNRFYKKLKSVELSELVSVHGIGPRTARFFLVHSRKNCNHAVLDTHVLKWLRNQYPANAHNFPKSTPPEKEYLFWETIFLAKAKELWPNKTIAEVDLEIWRKYKNDKTI